MIHGSERWGTFCICLLHTIFIVRVYKTGFTYAMYLVQMHVCSKHGMEIHACFFSFWSLEKESKSMQWKSLLSMDGFPIGQEAQFSRFISSYLLQLLLWRSSSSAPKFLINYQFFQINIWSDQFLPKLFFRFCLVIGFSFFQKGVRESCWFGSCSCCVVAMIQGCPTLH